MRICPELFANLWNFPASDRHLAIKLLNGAEYDMKNCADRPSKITPSEICIILHIARKLNPVTVLLFVKNVFSLSIKLAYVHPYSVSVFIGLACFRLRRYCRGVFEQLLLLSTLLYLNSTSLVAVFIGKGGHVWVSWPEEFLLYILSRTLQQVCYC